MALNWAAQAGNSSYSLGEMRAPFTFKTELCVINYVFSKIAFHYNCRKSLAPRKSCDKSDSYLSSRTSSPSPPPVSSPRPSPPSSPPPRLSPPSSPPPSSKKRNDLSRRGPVTSTQDSNDNANYNWNISSVPGYVDMRHVRQSQALRDIGNEYYPSRGSESDDSGSVSENEVGARANYDSDETYYDSQWDKKRQSDRETSPDPWYLRIVCLLVCFFVFVFFVFIICSLNEIH